jgi:hypothetical protein
MPTERTRQTGDPEGKDSTLGGYLRTHSRPPAFEGIDGEPYTVSPETEQTPSLAAPYEGYLVFPRWAATGAGIVGHLETPTLVQGRSRQEVLEALERLSLEEVKTLLDGAITRSHGAAG